MQRHAFLLACWFAIVLMLGLAGCESSMMKNFPPRYFKGETTLDRGIREYDEGNYKVAAKTIQSALDVGVTTSSQAKAHKYLAFMDCVAGQTSQCRDEFKKALAINPDFELSPAEAGHPIWGPVFRSVKSQPAK